jgi:hypothetical protein
VASRPAADMGKACEPTAQQPAQVVAIQPDLYPQQLAGQWTWVMSLLTAGMCARTGQPLLPGCDHAFPDRTIVHDTKPGVELDVSQLARSPQRLTVTYQCRAEGW